MIYYDNRNENPKYVFLFWPIFKPEYDDKRSLNEGNPFIIKSDNYNFENDILKIVSEKQKVSICRISDEINSNKFQEFKNKIKNHEIVPAVHLIYHLIGDHTSRTMIEEYFK